MGRPKKIQEKPELALEQSVEASQEYVNSIKEQGEESKKAVEGLTEAIKSLAGDNFVRDDNGKVDWRKMVKPEYVVVNNQYKDEIEKRYERAVTEIPVEQLEDKYLLILLAGTKELAELRGYSKVDYTIVSAGPEYVGMKCTISWKQFEDQAPIEFSSTADATPQNTSGFARDFLMATAENRAFVRCVRNFLKIHITGRDEVGSPQKVSVDDSGPTDKSTPLGSLKDKVEKSGKTFEQFKEWWVKQGNSEAESWNGWSSVPTKEVWNILGVLKSLEEERKKAKAAKLA